MDELDLPMYLLDDEPALNVPPSEERPKKRLREDISAADAEAVYLPKHS